MVEDPHELSALYALDALTGEDRERFEAHLASASACQEELAGLRGAAASLAFAVEGPAAAAELRGRILDACAREGRTSSRSVPAARSLLPIAAAVAVAACAAAVVLGLWASSLHHSLVARAHCAEHSRRPERAARRRLRRAGSARRRSVRARGARGALAAAAARQDIRSVGRRPCGASCRSVLGGTTTLPVARGARCAVMVTLENAGGVDAPTSKPLLSARA